MRRTCGRAGRKSPSRRWLVAGCLGTTLLCGGAVARAQALSPDQARESTSAAAADQAGPEAVTVDGNARRGRLLFLQCRSCHSVEEGGVAKVGPNLHGVFGSPAGQVEGFAYSEALPASGIVWSPKTLDAWLAAPSELVPGNRMIFTGIADPEDRADLIAYLYEATAGEE